MESLSSIIARSHHRTVPRLAAALLEAHPGDLKQANMENVIRKLVRGDTSWWRTRSTLSDALAAELGFDAGADLLDAVGTTATAHSSRWTFDTFPGLRPLDLATEAPFPGVPTELVEPGGPTRSLIWSAPAGSGRTLVGRWLEARWGWQFVEVDRVEELPGAVPDRGRVFAVIRRPVRGLAVQDQRLPDDVRFVVAVERLQEVDTWSEGWRDPFTHKASEPESTPSDEVLAFGRRGLGVVRCAPASTWLSELVEWAVARTSKQAALARDRRNVERWLTAIDVDDWFRTPGDVLELLAVVDQHGAKALPDEHTSPAAALTRWLRLRGQRPGPGRVPTPVLTGRRFDAGAALIDAEVRRLREGLPSSLDPETWRTLLPKVTLADLDAGEMATSPEGIVAALAARGVGLFDGLFDAGVLREAGRGLALQPTFAARWVRRAAVERLVAEGLRGVGVLLAHVDTVLPTLLWWVEEVEAGRLALLEAAAATAGVDKARDFALVVATDGAVRVAALARADLPPALVRRLLVAATPGSATFFSDVPPLPLVHVAAPTTDAGPSAVYATWLLRARLGQRAGQAMVDVLRAGATEIGAAAVVRAFDLGSRIPATQELAERWSEVIESVGAAVLGELGELHVAPGVPWAGHAPTRLAEAAARPGTVPPDALRTWASALRDIHAVRVCARRHRVDEAAVAHVLWGALPTPSGRDPIGVRRDSLFKRSAEVDRRWLWAQLPPGRIDAELWKAVLDDPEAVSSISDDAWRSMAELLRRPDAPGDVTVYFGERLWESIPDSVGITEALAFGTGGNWLALSAVAWRRWPDELHEGVLGLLAVDPPPWDVLRSLAVHAPDEAISRLIDALDDVEGPAPGGGKWLLGQLVFHQRGPWRRAWSRLVRDLT